VREWIPHEPYPRTEAEIPSSGDKPEITSQWWEHCPYTAANMGYVPGHATLASSDDAHREAGARRSYSAAGVQEGGPSDTAAATAAARGRARVACVTAVLAAACAVAVVGALGRGSGAGAAAGRRAGAGVMLAQTRSGGGSVAHELQLARDRIRVEELKAKLAKAETAGKAPSAGTGGAKKGRAPAPRAAAAAGSTASRALARGALRDLWLSSASKGHAAANPNPNAAARTYTPARLKKVQVQTVLKDIQQSLAAQQAATRAALMLLTSQDEAHAANSGSEEDVPPDSEGKRPAGDRGRTGLEEPAVTGGENETACTNFTVTNETECLPPACNATEINMSWNTSLPICAEAEEGNATQVNSSGPAATPAPWNEPQNTSEAAIESGAAGVVAGDVWAGPQPKPQYDTIYCYDDDADGGITRVARSATYCWYHRAYCQLYCQGDIMSTPPPIQMNSPAAAAYGWKSGYVSWASWAKRLKELSPYATFGAAMVGEPKFNYGGINQIHPVKVPETTGGRDGGIFEKYYQDGR